MSTPKWNRLLLVPVGSAMIFVGAAIALTIFGIKPINPGADLLLVLAGSLSLIAALMILLPEE